MYFIGSMLAVIIIPLIFIFAFGLPILAGVLVYRDANKRVDCSPWLWALVAALVPSFIGVIVYLIIRRDYPLKAAENRYQENGYTQQARYGGETPGAEKTGLPTWAKALIIIVSVIVAICVIALIVSFIGAVLDYGTMSTLRGSYHYDF